MTSTNDGKEVKSHETSAPRGKAYFIELYQSLDSRLNEAVTASERTTYVCEAWKKVHSLFLHSTASTHLHLLNWLQRHTARTVLQTGWQESKHRNDRASLTEAINVFIVACRASADGRDVSSLSWEAQLIARGNWFKTVQEGPWEHPVLLGLLNYGETPPTNDEVIEWLCQERGVTFLVRIQTLMTNKANDIAMKLVTAVMERARSDKPLLKSGEGREELEESNTFGERLREEAGFTEDLMSMLIDLEFVLLHKLDSSRCIAVAKQTPFQGLYKFLERLQSRSETSPREKKLWKNSKEVAVLIAQVVMARCMMVPVCVGEVRFALYASARFVARLVARARLPAATAALAAPAPTAAHLHTLALAIDKQFEEQNETSMKPFVCELYVRSITSGMNELERLKLDTEKDTEARLMEKTLASWFVQLGAVLASSDRLKAECELTAFSVHPSPLMYSRIKAAPALSPIQMDAVETSTPKTNTEFGSWASDSRSQTNFVKTSETLNMKKQSQANVLSTAIVNEGEALGLSPELCQDITTLLSGPRVKTLSWDMDRELMLENCRGYLDRTHGGTKAVTTELKYLNLNPADFQDLPEEAEEENNQYYGIEKGYEHLVELQPEEFLPSYDYDEVETAYTSEEYEEKPLRKKKPKKSAPVWKPGSDEDDPLSNVAENKRKDKNERTHSKEKSKNNDVDPLDIEIKEKKDKPKKDPKKKEKIPKPEGPLASLVGLKVAKTKKKAVKIIQSMGSDANNQGKSSMNSNVLYDGLYSMDDMKTPGNLSQSLESMGLHNIELSGNRSRKPTFYKPPSSSIPIASPSSYKSLSLSDQSRNNSPTPASDAVMSGLTKLLEVRRQTVAERKLPNAIMQPVCSLKIDGNFSPKGVEIPELPISYIDKHQIANTAIKSPVFQHTGKSPNKLSQSHFNFAKQYLQETMTPKRRLSTPPPADKFLECVNLVSIYDKEPPCSQNYSEKFPNVSQKKLKPAVNYHGINELGTPSAYNQYPVSKQYKKDAMRPVSKAGTVSKLKSVLKTQSAKQIQQKKPDGNLNTFSRLTYFKNQQLDRSKTMETPQTVGQKLDNFIWDNIKKLTSPRSNPTMTTMLGAPSIPPARPTLSEKDQNELIHLLRQQDVLNRHNVTLPQSNVRFPVPSTSKTNATAIPSNQIRLPDQSHKAKINIISTSIIKPITDPKPTKNKNSSSEGRSRKPKSKKPMPEWKNVMDAISKHKTPSRGPNALDMALKNSSFEKAFEESLRKSSTLFTDNTIKMQDKSSIGPHQQEFANFAKSVPKYPISDTISIVKNKNNSLTKNSGQQTIKTNNRNSDKKNNSINTKSATSIGEVIPQTENKSLVQNTKAISEPKQFPKTKKSADLSMAQKTKEQESVERKIENLMKNNRIEFFSKNKSNKTSAYETTSKLQKVLQNNSVAMQKQLIRQNSLTPKMPKQAAVDPKKETKPVTGHKMPENIKQYIYPEPNLGVPMPGMQNSEYDQLDELIDDDLRKEMDELSSDEDDYIPAAQSLLINTKTNEKSVNVAYNQPANDVVYSYPLNNIEIKTSHVIDLRPSKKNDIPQSIAPVSQQRFNKPTNINNNREDQNKASLNTINLQTVTTQSPPFVQALNYNNNNLHTLAEPNVYLTSPQSVTVQNTIIIPPNVVYGYAEIQTLVQAPSMIQETNMAAKNAPSVNEATPFSFPVLSPTASTVAVPIVNVPSATTSRPTPDTTVTTSQYSYVNSEQYQPKHTTDQEMTNRQVDVIDSVSCVANAMPQNESRSNETNIIKSGERMVLKEVQERYAGENNDEQTWSQNLSEKHKTQADLERVIKKRILILNRQISHNCGFQTIPLGYSPLRVPNLENKELDVADSKSISDNPNQNNLHELNYEEERPATPDSYKENKDEVKPVRRILLRSSNKLKSKLSQPAHKLLAPADKKLKGSPSVSSETPNEILTKIDQSHTETKNKQRRVSKRIQNKIVAPQYIVSKDEECNKLEPKRKAQINEITPSYAAQPNRIIDSETNQFFDVEAELLGSTIPKIMPLNLFSPHTLVISDLADNESLSIPNDVYKDLAVDQTIGSDTKSLFEKSAKSKTPALNIGDLIKPVILSEATNQFTVVPIETTVLLPTAKPIIKTDDENTRIPTGDLKTDLSKQISDKMNDVTLEVNYGVSKGKELELNGKERYVCGKDNKTISEVNSDCVKSFLSHSISETPSKSITEVIGKEIHRSIVLYGDKILPKEDELASNYIQSDTHIETLSKTSTLVSLENETLSKTSTPVSLENDLKAEATEIINDENIKVISKQTISQRKECESTETQPIKDKLQAEVSKGQKYTNAKVLGYQTMSVVKEPVIKSLESDSVPSKNVKKDPKPGFNVSKNVIKNCAKAERSVDKNNALQLTSIDKVNHQNNTADSHKVLSLENKVQDDDDIRFIDEIPPIKPLQNKAITDEITIESVANAENGDPLKKTVRIVANGKLFKGTISGSVDIDSLFDKPEVLALLMKQFKQSKKNYSIKFHVDKTNDNKIVSSLIEEQSLQHKEQKKINMQTAYETVSLLSDDEEESSQELKTEFGKFKIKSLGHDIFTKHQNKLELKSYVSVKKMTLDEEAAVKRRMSTKCRETKLNLDMNKNPKISLQQECNSQSKDSVNQTRLLCQETLNEPKMLRAIPDLVQGIFCDFENILVPVNKQTKELVVLIDDSSNDSVDVKISEPMVKLDALKDMLLKDFGVLGSSPSNDGIQATEVLDLTDDNARESTECNSNTKMADIINRKCFVKLIRCDYNVEKLKPAKADNSKSMEKVDFEPVHGGNFAEENREFKDIHDIDFAPISRSSSLSILEVIEDIPVINSRITETLDRSSPVMEVYELISSMEGKLSIYPNMIKVHNRLKCDSEWRTTKSVEHLKHKNLSAKKSASCVPNLVTLVLSCIEKEDLVNRYNNNVIKMHPSSNFLKRKLKVSGAPTAKVLKIDLLPKRTEDNHHQSSTIADFSAINVSTVTTNDNDPSAHIDEQPTIESEDMTPDLLDLDTNTDMIFIDNEQHFFENRLTSHTFESKRWIPNRDAQGKGDVINPSEDDLFKSKLGHTTLKDLVQDTEKSVTSTIVPIRSMDKKEVENPLTKTNFITNFPNQEETEDIECEIDFKEKKDNVNNYTKIPSKRAGDVIFGHYENITMVTMKTKGMGIVIDVDNNKESFDDKLENCLQEHPDPKLSLQLFNDSKESDTEILIENITEWTEVLNKDSIKTKSDQNAFNENTDQIGYEIYEAVCNINNVETTIDIQPNVECFDLSKCSHVNKLFNKTLECESLCDQNTDNNIKKMDKTEVSSATSMCDENHLELNKDIQMNVKHIDSSDYVEMIDKSTTTCEYNNISEIIEPSKEDIVEGYMETKMDEGSSIMHTKDEIAESYLEPNIGYCVCHKKSQVQSENIDQDPVYFLPCKKTDPETTIKAHETDMCIFLPDNINDKQSIKCSDSKINKISYILPEVKDQESVNVDVSKDLPIEITDEVSFVITSVPDKNLTHELNLSENIIIGQEHQEDEIHSPDKSLPTDDVLSTMNKIFGESENMDSISDSNEKDISNNILSAHTTISNNLQNILEGTESVNMAQVLIQENENCISRNELHTVRDDDKRSNYDGDCNIDGLNVSLREGLYVLDDSLTGTLVNKTFVNDNSDKLLSILPVPQMDAIANNLQGILEGSESVNVVQVLVQENDHYIPSNDLATVGDNDKLSNHHDDWNIDGINVSSCESLVHITCVNDNSDKLSTEPVDSPQATDAIANNLQKMFEGSESVNVVQALIQENDHYISPNDFATVHDNDILSNHDFDCNIDEINVSLREGLSVMEDSHSGSLINKTCVKNNSDKRLSILPVNSPQPTEKNDSNLQKILERSECINVVQVLTQENDHSISPNEFATASDDDRLSNNGGDLDIDEINVSLREGLSVLEDSLSGSRVEEIVDMSEINNVAATSTSKNIEIEILTGNEYQVPEVKSRDVSTIVDEEFEEGIVNYDDDYNENIKLIIPKHTYSNDNSFFIKQSRRLSRSLKRKKDMSDIKTSERKYRKGKHIDYPKITATAIAELAYAKEHKRIIDYCSTIKFSYNHPFHIEHIDVGPMLKAWPIQKQLPVKYKTMSNQDQGLLYTYTDDNEKSMAVTDPLNQTLNEEILNGGKVINYKSFEINEKNFNMGFGEKSGRVIQKKLTGITKLSAATLSDVKHYQPFLKFDASNVKENLAYATQKDKLSQLNQLINVKQKVKSYFKQSAIQLVRESLQDKELLANDREFADFPFGLTSTEFIEVPTIEAIVNMVQVGQLPVSASAQNPVTCDPRVTHVSDAIPSQCSDNSPGYSQATIETEYTELTTANITLPMQVYSQQHQSPKSQGHNSPLHNNDCNSTQTLSIVKIELVEDDSSQENDVYENAFSPLPTNSVDYSFEDTNILNSNKTANNNSNMYNATDITSNKTLTNIFNSPTNMDNSYANLDNRSANMDSTYTNVDNGNGSNSIYSASSSMGNSSNEIENSVHNNMDDATPYLDTSFKHMNRDNPSNNINTTYTSLYTSMGSHSNASISNDMSCNSSSNANNSPIHLENKPTNIITSPRMDNTNSENAYEYSYENIADYTDNLEENNYNGNVENFTDNDFASNVDNYPSNVDNYATNTERYPNTIHSFDTSVENYSSHVENNTFNINNPIKRNNLDNSTNNTIEDPQPQDLSMGNSTRESKVKSFDPQENDNLKPDQLANAMNAAGISSESVISSRANELVNLMHQTAQTTANNIQKSSPINVMTLQQALAQVLPPPLNQTGASENTTSNNSVAQQVLHIVQGSNNAQTVINKANGTHLLHIVQNKNNPAGNGLSLVDAGLQHGGNQLIHIVNNGSQNNGQFLKRVNLLTNLTNAQGSSEQKMIQFVCKSADGKSIQLNAGHQRSMVLRLHPNAVQAPMKQTEPQDLSASTSTANTTDNQDTSKDIKSTSVSEENYAQLMQNPTPVAGTSTTPHSPEKSTSLPKFNQVFGKQSYQENQTEIRNGLQENSKETPEEQNSGSLDQSAETNNPPLLVRNVKTETTQAQSNPPQQIKQSISPMNIHTTMHGGVIYTRQIPVSISGGQTINLITVPSTEQVDSAQKQQTGGTFANQDGETSSIIKLVPHHVPNNGNPTPEEKSAQPSTSIDAKPTPQPPPQPVMAQMRIKLPMLSKGPHIVPGARLVRPSFFQIQRNVIPGTNPPVYQQLVLTTAPSLGKTIRLPTQGQSQQVSSPQAQPPLPQPILVQPPQHTTTPHIPVQQVQHAPSTIMHSAPPTPVRQSAPARNKCSEPESELSTLTLEQLREFDMVLEQVKERSVQPMPATTPATKPATPADTTDGPTLSTTSVSESTQQVIYSVKNNQPANVVSYVNRKSTITSATTSFVRSPDSSGIVDTPSSSTVQITHTVTKSTTSEAGSSAVSQPKKKKKKKPSSSSSALTSLGSPSKTNSLKPQEDEQTTQRILYILAEYKEQVANSPDKHKPAPRRRNQFTPTPGSKRKRSHCSSRSSCRHEGADMSPVPGENGEDSLIALGSDSSCGTTFSECTDCQDSHSPEESPTKIVRQLTFEQETTTQITQTRTVPQRNIIVGDGQAITVARTTTATAAAVKPTTTVLMPANYLLPVSMIKGGQQIAIMTNRGPKILVGAGESNAGALLFQRLIGPGLRPVLARPGVRHIRLPATALHNLQTFNIQTTPVSGAHPPNGSVPQAPMPAPPDLVDTRATTSPWQDKPDRGPSPDCTEPWNMPSSSIADDYGYEEIVRTDNMERTVLDAMPDRYSPDMEAQRIFDNMFDHSKKSMYDSPRCGYDVDTSDGDDKPYHQVVQQRKDGRHHRVTHVSTAALRHKYAILEHELRLQKSLSEECEDLGVDSPSASDLFPEADILFGAPSPAHEQTIDQCNTPPPIPMPQSIQPESDEQIATDQLLTPDTRDEDLDLNLDDVGEMVTVGEDGVATISTINAEEFARSHPNTTFHTEPEDGEIPPFTIAQTAKGPHITFHGSRVPGTVVMPPQTTVISQATVNSSVGNNTVKFTDIDNMINSIPCPQVPVLAKESLNPAPRLPKFEAKGPGASSASPPRAMSKFDSLLAETKQQLSTARHAVHSTGNGTQVIRRLRGDERTHARTNSKFHFEEPRARPSVSDEMRLRNDRAIVESMGDNASSPGHPELYWDSTSADKQERRFHFGESDKVAKSPFDELLNDCSAYGPHTRLDSVIKAARPERTFERKFERTSFEGIGVGGAGEDTRPLRTYPPKRAHSQHLHEDDRRATHRAGSHHDDRKSHYHDDRKTHHHDGAKKRVEPPRCQDGEGRRRTGRGVVKRGCSCCSGPNAPPKKRSRPKKPSSSALDFTSTT